MENLLLFIDSSLRFAFTVHARSFTVPPAILHINLPAKNVFEEEAQHSPPASLPLCSSARHSHQSSDCLVRNSASTKGSLLDCISRDTFPLVISFIPFSRDQCIALSLIERRVYDLMKTYRESLVSDIVANQFSLAAAATGHFPLGQGDKSTSDIMKLNRLSLRTIYMNQMIEMVDLRSRQPPFPKREYPVALVIGCYTYELITQLFNPDEWMTNMMDRTALVNCVLAELPDYVRECIRYVTLRIIDRVLNGFIWIDSTFFDDLKKALNRVAVQRVVKTEDQLLIAGSSVLQSLIFDADLTHLQYPPHLHTSNF